MKKILALLMISALLLAGCENSGVDYFGEKNLVYLTDGSETNSQYTFIENKYKDYLIDNSYKSFSDYYDCCQVNEAVTVEVSEEILLKFIEAVNEAEAMGSELFRDGHGNPDDGNFVINMNGNHTMVKYEGENDTLKKVLDNTKDMCSPVFFQKIMSERYYYSFDGEIFLHAAGGFPTFAELTNVEKCKVLDVEGNTVRIEAVRNLFGDDEAEFVCVYSVHVAYGNPYICDYEVVRYCDGEVSEELSISKKYAMIE